MEWLVTAAIVATLGGTAALSVRAGRVADSAALSRPREFPSAFPSGQDARDIRFDGWIRHPGIDVTPRTLVAAFGQAEFGDPSIQCDLFDDVIERDCHLRNLFEQREQAVAGKPWVIQADGQDADAVKGAQILGELLKRLPLIEVFQHLLTANRYGYACAEIDWGLVTIGGQVWIAPVWITPVPARRFRVNTGANGQSGGSDELRLYADTSRPMGDPLRPGKWIVLRRSGAFVTRSGLMRTAVWPAMGKRLGFKGWIIYADRFGKPLPIIDYDRETADDDDKALAEEILRRIGSDGGAVKPNDLVLKFEDATRGNAENSKSHGGLISHCNGEMSKLVNGSTLSNDSQGSSGASYALGEVHDTVRWDNVVFDAERLQEAFRTQLAAPFMAFNNLIAPSPLLKVQVVRDLDPKTRAEVADVFVNKLGIKVSIAQMRQEVGYREPAGDGDAAPGAPTPAPAAPGRPS